MDETLRATGTPSDFVEVESPISEVYKLKGWMHIGQGTWKKLCNWQVIFCSKETTEIWRLKLIIPDTHVNPRKAYFDSFL